MTLNDSITRIAPIIGRYRAVLVSMATMARVMPKDMAPVSPIIKRAGLMLNHKKAKRAPTMTPQKAVKSYLPRMKEMAHKEPKLVSKTPAASPSSPSVSLTEKAVATRMKMKMGMYHQPISNLPTKGICKTSQSSL